MSGRLHAVRGEAAPEHAPIAADRLLEGAPRTSTRIDHAQGETVFAGEWSAGIGAWRVQYEEWEFCHVLDGACEIIGEDGVARRFSAGDSFVIEPGFSGIWRVLEPMRKRFFVRYG